MRDFDNHFRNIQKRQTTLFQVAIWAWVVGALLSLGILGAIGYVALHFLAKVW